MVSVAQLKVCRLWLIACLCIPFVAAETGFSASSENNTLPLQDWTEQQIKIPALNGSLWGGIATYADDSGSELFNIQADTRLTPASTLKLVTTAAALELLGPNYRFQTRLYAEKTPDTNGRLAGSLYVRGGGDATLGSSRVTGAETSTAVLNKWVNALKKEGIRYIDGDIIADESLFEGPSIATKVNWANIGNYFAAPATPLCFNDNLFTIHFKPQPLPNRRATVESVTPGIEGLRLESFVTTDGKTKKDNAYVYGAPGQYHLQIFGTIPTNKNGFAIKGALPDPALFTVQSLKKTLEENGITVSGTAKTVQQEPDYSSMQLLHTYKSPALKDIVVIVNKRSFNLYAEMLLRALALEGGQKASLENGLAVLNKFLKDNKITTAQEAVIYDGSGLSRDNLITPRTLVKTLNFMAKSPNFDYYYKSLATPDDRGDLLILRRFLKPQKKVNEVRIKGGTIDNTKALAGYVYDKEGRLISFAFMANNLAGKDEGLFRLHENIIKQLLESN
jgi:D-alanyl-D-alanine carboxypeptidase/D-alanyl-D-alanine-endopeptidase (penicillin-binding protein 4)